MNRKKRQIITIIMAITLSISTILNPTTLKAYGKEDVMGHRDDTSLSARLKSGNLAITSANFPDVEFRNYIEANFDIDKNQILSVDEIDKITAIDLSSYDRRGMITSLEGLKYFIKLDKLNCSETAIDQLDVSENQNLTYLNCSKTDFYELNILNNRMLTDLICRSTSIGYLEFKNNVNLKYVDCSNNSGLSSLYLKGADSLETLICASSSISELNVSHNKNISYLDCSSNSIDILDVSNCSNLNELYCDGNPLKYVNIGTLVNLSSFKRPVPSQSFIYTSDPSFRIQGVIPGIDISKINFAKDESDAGLTYDKATGVISGYGKKKGTIAYSYDCGESQYGTEQLEVYLDIIVTKKESSVIIQDSDLSKVYDGTPVIAPKVTVTGSSGKVSYIWTKWNGLSWESLRGAPSTIGKYRVMAYVLADENFNTGYSMPVEFSILKLTPPVIMEPKQLSGVYGASLSSIKLEDGWFWADENQMLSANNSGYYARKMVNDELYDYTHIDGYQSSGHYVERKIMIDVAAAENRWIKEPSITNWTLKETPSVPQGEAAYGDVIFMYCDKKDGNFTTKEPDHPGTWYMMGVVKETPDYTGLSKIVTFTIEEAILPPVPTPQDPTSPDPVSDHPMLADVTPPTSDTSNVGMWLFMIMLAGSVLMSMRFKENNK